MEYFPEVEVQHVVGAGRNPQTGMTDISITASQLQRLLDVGAANPTENQNASPSIREFFDALGKDERVRFIGYVCWPPRRDARVSIEGFEGTGFSKAEADRLTRQYQADEVTVDPLIHGSYYVRFWWD